MYYHWLGREAEKPSFIGIDLSSLADVYSMSVGDAFYVGTRKFIAEKAKQVRRRDA